MKNKYSKPHSLTTDTRLSQSHIFNNSVLNRTNLSTSSQKQNQANQIQKQIQYSEIKQSQFLQIKNTQLQEKVKRMKQKIQELQSNKKYLLDINEKYVHIINQYYRDLQTQQTSKNFKSSKEQVYKSKGLEQTSQKENISSKLNQDQLTKIKNYHKNCFTNFNNQQGQILKVFANLEKNHRNLVKHCLAMQDEINNYKTQMTNFNQMKAQLYSVNHTNVSQLIEELKQSSQQNKELKIQNNRLSFQLEKSISECQKLRKMNQKQTKASSTSNNQAQKLRCEINTIKQVSMDNEKQYESTIYQLNLKVEKLQKQLRREDSQFRRNFQKRKQIEIQQVQKIHQNSKLKQNISELLNFKKYSMLSLDRSFCVKSKNKVQL